MYRRATSAVRLLVVHPIRALSKVSNSSSLCKPMPVPSIVAVERGVIASLWAPSYQQKQSLSTSSKRFSAHEHHTFKGIEERIMLVLQLYDKVDPEKVTMDSDFFNDLGIDSLDFVEVILELETEFFTEIPDGDVDRLRTPRQIHQYLCDKFDVID